MSEEKGFEDRRQLFRKGAVNKLVENDELGVRPKLIYPHPFTVTWIIVLLVLGAGVFAAASVFNGVSPLELLNR